MGQLHNIGKVIARLEVLRNVLEKNLKRSQMRLMATFYFCSLLKFKSPKLTVSKLIIQ